MESFTNAFVAESFSLPISSTTPEFNRYQSQQEQNQLDRSLQKYAHLVTNIPHHNHEGDEVGHESASKQSDEQNYAVENKRNPEFEDQESDQGGLQVNQGEIQSNQADQSQADQESNQRELGMLKTKMIEIEYIASTEIKVLRQQNDSLLQQNRVLSDRVFTLEKQLAQNNINHESSTETAHQSTATNTESGIRNTESDISKQEIKALKEGLIRHVRINKYLLENSLSKENQPFTNVQI